mmetsp:Transcript_779/g.1636  ORF Transcript_779/g.1636 Transcript_779/m.1636 type:complete len:178 (+) Transcript_779:186-719(+)
MAGTIQWNVSQDEAIRFRLLHSLGIQKSKALSSATIAVDSKEKGASSISPIQRPANINISLLRDAVSIRRSLNDSEEHRSRRPSVKGRKRLVRFNNIVTEKQIASHKKYSDRMKRTLWSDSVEIKENAFRNQLEFQAEGMNWESVLENDDMYVDTNTGELIHPFWVESEDVLNMSKG